MANHQSSTPGREAVLSARPIDGGDVLEESLEQKLAALAPDLRRASMPQLLHAELQVRRQRGETPRENEYAQRLPELADLVSAVFQAERDSQSVAGGPTVSMAARRADSEPLLLASLTIGDSSEPHSVGRYQLQSMVGRGGFAQVWRAIDPALDRVVAVKVLRPDRATYPEAQGQMLAEARRLARLNLPGLVPVYDIVEEQGKCFVVSKFIPGGTLADRLTNHRFSPPEAAQFVAQIADTLHRAHLQDVVHRDVKPGNILLDEENAPLVADFGLAITEAEQREEPRCVLGSYGYMSPEQARSEGHLVDARTDVYSLGMVFYELLTGRIAFLGDSPDEYLEQILKRQPRPPRTIDDSIPAELERICLKCLAKESHARYSTAADLATDLRNWLRLQASHPPISRDRTSVLRTWLAGGLLVAVLLAAAWFARVWLQTPMPQAVTPVAPVVSTPEPASPPIPEPSPQEQEYKLWQRRFGAKPTELHWPGYRDLSTLGFREEIRALEISSRSPRLLALGKLESGKHLISVGLSKPGSWEGGCGIFYNYREVLVEGQAEAQFNAVSLGAGEDSKGIRQLRAKAWDCRISPRDGTIYPLREYGVQVVPWPPTDVMSRLELQFDNQQLNSVRWAGIDLVETLKRKPPPAGSGIWGLVHASNTSWFQDPRSSTFEPQGQAKP